MKSIVLRKIKARPKKEISIQKKEANSLEINASELQGKPLESVLDRLVFLVPKIEIWHLSNSFGKLFL